MARSPKLVKKHQRSFKGFDDKILSMYARGTLTAVALSKSIAVTCAETVAKLPLALGAFWRTALVGLALT